MKVTTIKLDDSRIDGTSINVKENITIDGVEFKVGEVIDKTLFELSLNRPFEQINEQYPNHFSETDLMLLLS